MRKRSIAGAELHGTFAEGASFGHYEIRSLIGVNMIEVYRAQDRRYGRDVALCIFSPRLSGVELENKKRELQREMDIGNALNNHPNVVAVFELGTWGGRLFIARELIEGQSLRNHMRGNSLNIATSVDYARQIVTMLEAAHDCGMVHGCLRPSAIFVTGNSRIKVFDLGVEPSANAKKAITSVYDPAYMSPEQLSGARGDARSDFFAFGAILYEMLTGVSPFQHDSYSETAHSVLRDNPRLLSELNPHIPRVLALLVESCLAKDRDKRPVSARKIALGLKTSSLT